MDSVESVVGLLEVHLRVHLQVAAGGKLFCGCSYRHGTGGALSAR